LRVDRGLSFAELARITLAESPAPDELALSREEARLRKRYERITHQLRVLARAEGLLD